MNFKKIAITVAVVAVVIIVAVVVISNWGTWFKNGVDAIGNGIGVHGVGDAIFGDTLSGGTTVDLTPTA